MAKHVAILSKKYLDLIITGQKSIESRLTKYKLPPYQSVAPNDIIYFKQSAGPFRAKATIQKIITLDNLTPDKIKIIRKQYNHHILATPDYWLNKKYARYATLIFLKNIQPHATKIPFGPSWGKAWFVIQ